MCWKAVFVRIQLFTDKARQSRMDTDTKVSCNSIAFLGSLYEIVQSSRKACCNIFSYLTKTFLKSFLSFEWLKSFLCLHHFLLEEAKKTNNQTSPRCITIHFNFVSLEFRWRFFMEGSQIKFYWIESSFIFYCVCLRLASIIIDSFGSCMNLSSSWAFFMTFSSEHFMSCERSPQRAWSYKSAMSSLPAVDSQPRQRSLECQTTWNEKTNILNRTKIFIECFAEYVTDF